LKDKPTAQKDKIEEIREDEAREVDQKNPTVPKEKNTAEAQV
jgi:hypothetical protein